MSLIGLASAASPPAVQGRALGLPNCPPVHPGKGEMAISPPRTLETEERPCTSCREAKINRQSWGGAREGSVSPGSRNTGAARRSERGCQALEGVASVFPPPNLGYFWPVELHRE